MRKATWFGSGLVAGCAWAAVCAAQAPGAQGPPPQTGQQSSQGAQAAQAPRQPRPIAVEQLSPDVYWVRNIGFGAFIVGDKGVIVVDTGSSPAAGKQILDAIAKVTPKPVDTLILSHCDGDHVNGIAAFPAGIKIIAQENDKKFLEEAMASGEPGPEAVKVPADHMPNQTVADREDITIDGVKMQLLHWAPAHTSGDLAVYLPAEKLVLVSDLIVMDQHGLPLVHMDKGGTSKGWIESIRGLLALDANKYVVGHEGVVGKDVLEQQLKTTLAERQKVKELYDQGKSLKEIQAAVGDPVPPPPGTPVRPAHFPPFSEVVYQELKAGTY